LGFLGGRRDGATLADRCARAGGLRTRAERLPLIWAAVVDGLASPAEFEDISAPARFLRTRRTKGIDQVHARHPDRRGQSVR
jgi:hypothetical protein